MQTSSVQGFAQPMGQPTGSVISQPGITTNSFADPSVAAGTTPTATVGGTVARTASSSTNSSGVNLAGLGIAGGSAVAAAGIMAMPTHI